MISQKAHVGGGRAGRDFTILPFGSREVFVLFFYFLCVGLGGGEEEYRSIKS